MWQIIERFSRRAAGYLADGYGRRGKIGSQTVVRKIGYGIKKDAALLPLVRPAEIDVDDRHILLLCFVSPTRSFAEGLHRW